MTIFYRHAMQYAAMQWFAQLLVCGAGKGVGVVDIQSTQDMPALIGSIFMQPTHYNPLLVQDDPSMCRVFPGLLHDTPVHVHSAARPGTKTQSGYVQG